MIDVRELNNIYQKRRLQQHSTKLLMATPKLTYSSRISGLQIYEFPHSAGSLSQNGTFYVSFVVVPGLEGAQHVLVETGGEKSVSKAVTEIMLKSALDKLETGIRSNMRQMVDPVFGVSLSAIEQVQVYSIYLVVIGLMQQGV
jgi:hypothetical protein